MRPLTPLLAVLLALFFGACSDEGERQPNVILIVVDTLRADRLSQYGYPLDTSGALSDFSDQAFRFTECYAPAPYTTPSTASIVSGLLPARHGAGQMRGNVLAEEILTLAEVLSGHGLATAGFSANINVSRKTRFNQGFDAFFDFEGQVLGYPDIGSLMAALEGWLGEHEGRQPYFLYLQPMNTHGPYRVPEAARARLLGRPPSDVFNYLQPPLTWIMGGAIHLRPRIGEEYLTSLDEQYDTAVRYTADTLADLFTLLRRRGEYDDSLIIVTSDHGEELFDHGGFSHGYSLYREVLHVPLLIKLPGGSAGGEIAHRVSLVDLYPTVLDVLGLPAADDLDGASLLPALRRAAAGSPGAARQRDLVFATGHPKRCIARAILSGPWKLVQIERNYESPIEQTFLFRVDEDPRETRPLTDEHPEVAADLLARMEQAFADYRRRAVETSGERDVELNRETLEALGYL